VTLRRKTKGKKMSFVFSERKKEKGKIEVHYNQVEKK
jgi:hypothetical protein